MKKEQILIDILTLAKKNNVRIRGIVISPREFRVLKEELKGRLIMDNLGCIQYPGPAGKVEIIKDIYD